MTTTTTETIQATETTTPAAETAPAKPAKKAKAKISYPFPTKREVLAAQASDDVVLEHLGILYQRQTDDEKERKETKWKNRRGFMSSHAVNGTKVAEKVAMGEELSEADWAMARGIVSHYGKQLAAHYREEMIEANPELAKIAEIFSAG